jgi:tetratricopeptide (TPR) repeat protein
MRASRLPGIFAVAALVGVGGAAARDAPKSAPPTVGDLRAQDVPMQPSRPGSGGAARAMDNYRQFLQLQNADPKLRAEALRRLGDLNLESGELERMASEVTQLDLAGAEAIRLYTTLLRAYPDYGRNDEVLYQLSRAYETTGQRDQALATLDSIVARYPNGRDIAEVQFRRGELLFSDRRYADAERAYAAVIARGRAGSPFYSQSLYKRGWSLFKQSLNEESLPSFAEVLDLTLLDAGGQVRNWEQLSRPDRELAEDTLRVTSISFSYLDGAQSIDQLLARRGQRAYAWLLYSRLGDLYVDKQRYQDAAATYRAFVAGHPLDEHAPVLSTAAIEAYRKGGFADLVLEGKVEYIQHYGFDAAFWQGRAHAAYPDIVAELKTDLKDVAQHFHATAQKSKRAEDYGAAAHWYRAFLAAFPGEADSADTNYLLADALFESHQYLDAAGEYEHTAYEYPRGVRSAEAGYAALVAYQKQEEAVPASERAALHARAVESSLHFAQTFSEHPEAAGVLTRAAQDLFAAGDLTRASASAQTLLERVPSVDAAKQRIGWMIVGQSEFNQNHFDKAEGAFTNALRVAPPGDTERADITERLAAAVYKQAEARRAAGDEAGAADDFLRVARVAPGAKAVATAQYDAAAALINAKQWDRAIEVLESYRRDYPKSEYAADVTRKLAVAYVEAGRAGAAAGEFERIAADSGEDRAVVHEALGRAADLYQQAGNDERATVMLERLVAQYPTPVPEAIEARSRLMALAAKGGNATRERYWQTEIVKADASAGSARTDRTRYLAAKAQLALAAPARDAFRAVRLVAPLKKTLEAKKNALQTAVNAYKAVAEYQVAETTTTATYETGELYRTLAHDLLESERPKNLNADERDQYDSLLEEQAFPFEEQAISIHELNVQRAHDGVYDDSVRASYRALAELKPARYGKSERGEQPLVSTAFTGEAMWTANDIDIGLADRDAGKLTEAEQVLLRATAREANVNTAVAWDELGITRRMAGKFGDARAAYEQAIAANAEYAPVHRNLGVLMDLYLDQPTVALGEFEHYRELGGEDKPLTAWIAELRARTGVKPPAAAQPAPSTDAQSPPPADAQSGSPGDATNPPAAAGDQPAAEADKGGTT